VDEGLRVPGVCSSVGIVKYWRLSLSAFGLGLVAAFVACAAPTPDEESPVEARRRANGDSEEETKSATVEKPAIAKDAAAPTPTAPDGGTVAPNAVQNGCADGTREGLTDLAAFPNVAACGGSWAGNVTNGRALCAPGWGPCQGGNPALKTITFAAATAFAGCFAMDTAHDSNSCRASCSGAVQQGVDSAGDIDMGGVGRDCRFKDSRGASCIGSGRVDSSHNSDTGCNFAPGISGVVCCKE
jgi:hypothetical protein